MANEIELRTIGKPQIALERADGTCLRLELTDYALLLREAKRNGWEPIGDSWSDGLVWLSDLDSDYLFAKTGCVWGHDALGIANALRKMVTQTDIFLNRDVYQVEFYRFEEMYESDMDDCFCQGMA